MKRSPSHPARRELVAAIRQVGASQGGVVMRSQLVGLGVSMRTVRRWADGGDLTEVARGVYAFDRPVSASGQRWAAHLSVGRHSVVTGDSALDALDVISTPRKPVHLVVSRRLPRPQTGVIVRQHSLLHRDDIVDLEGQRCATFAYALVDAAASSDASRLDRILDRAVQLRLFDPVAAEAVLGRRRVSASTRAIEAAIDRLDATAGNNRTELERRVIALIRDSWLPPAVNNARVGPFEVDVMWVGTRAIVEADGDRYHSTPAQIAADIEKRKALEAYGFEVMRLNWADTNYDTDRTLERVDRFRLSNLLPPVPGPPPELILTARRNGH